MLSYKARFVKVGDFYTILFIFALLIMTVYRYCGKANNDRVVINSNESVIAVNRYGIIVKDSTEVYTDIKSSPSDSTFFKMSDIVFIESKIDQFYKVKNSNAYIIDSCVVLVDSILYQTKVGSFVFQNTIHDIFRVKGKEYIPIYIALYTPYLSKYDYMVKKHLAMDIKFVFGDDIHVDSSLYLIPIGNINLIGLRSSYNEYQFFVIKDSTSHRIGISIFWGKNINTGRYVYGKGSKYFNKSREVNESNKKRNRIVGTWQSGEIKWIFKENGVLSLISGDKVFDYTWSLDTNFKPYHLDLKIEGEPIVIKAIIKFIDDNICVIETDRDLNRNIRPKDFSDFSSYLYRIKSSGEKSDYSLKSYESKDIVLKNKLLSSYKKFGIIDVQVNDFYVILEVNETLAKGFTIDKIRTLTIMESIINTIKDVTRRNFGVVEVYYMRKKILKAESKILDDGIKIKYYN
ncbi:MAG: hypothetical protein H0Z29_11500 [Candidatus Marinimicrobia bacterium]|nr:hypothetical protein [Candidatus Neomarinimicrobiota bacterium]